MVIIFEYLGRLIVYVFLSFLFDVGECGRGIDDISTFLPSELTRARP